MTFALRAGRFAGITLMVGLLLAGCDKGPDRNQVAAELQKSVEGYLAEMEGPADKRALSHSSVKVTPQQDTGYLVSIDGLKVAADADGYLDIGTISYVLTPKDDKTYTADKLSLPAEMPFKLPDGSKAGGVTLTNKSFSGLWLKEAESFLKLDLQLTDIEVKDAKQSGDLKMAGIALTTNSTDKGNGRWDQVGKLTISGLDVDEGESRMKVATVDVSSAFLGVKLADYAAKLREMREATAKQAASNANAGGNANGSGSSATSPSTDGAAAGNSATGNAAGTTASAAAAAPVEEFVKALPGLMTGSTIDLHFNGVTYSEGEGKAAFELGKVGLSLGATGFDQPKSNLTFTIDHDGLVLHLPQAESALAKASLPASGTLTVTLVDLPTADLVSALADGASMYGADPTQVDAKTALFLAKFQQLLQQDGVKLKVEPSHLTSAAANLTADGDFVLQSAAIYGATGGLNIAITGIDQLMQLAQQEADQDPQAAQYAGVLQALLGYAAREQGSDGKPVDRFKIDVPQNGQLTVNGKPFQF